MTSNAPRDALKDIFRPEFLNRLDEILEFDPLGEKEIAAIVRLQLKDFAKRLADEGYTLDVDDDAIAVIAKEGYDPAFGARPVRRAIQKLLETPIAKKIVAGDFVPGARITVSANGGEIAISASVPSGDLIQ